MQTCWEFIIGRHFSLPSGYVDRSLHSKLEDLTPWERFVFYHE